MRDSEIRVSGESFARISGPVAEAFFATVSYRLEQKGWGTRFPVVLNNLYHGRISAKMIPGALSELNTIENELRALPVDKVVWDFQDLRPREAGEEVVNHTATNVQEYFVSSRAVPLTVELKSALAFSAAKNVPLAMRTAGSGSMAERLKGLLWVSFGVVWVGIGYCYFPNWVLQPVGATSPHGVLIWPFGIVFFALGLVIAIRGPHDALLVPRKKNHARLLMAGCVGVIAALVYFGYR